MTSFDNPEGLSGEGFYSYDVLSEYEQFFGRLVVGSDYKKQQARPWAVNQMSHCWVHQIHPQEWEFEDDFPGYHWVDLPWKELAAALKLPSWRTALGNQKGIYLITDHSNGLHYVGSAYGKDELLGRWGEYARTGHGGNVDLRRVVKEKGLQHLKDHFRFSLLETTGALTPDKEIQNRERHWKSVLGSFEHGYNKNM